MRTPEQTARRWFAQAEHSLAAAHVLLREGFWSGACFHAEQTAKLAQKGFLFSRGRRSIPIYSAGELAVDCAQEDADFAALVDQGAFLDRFYLATRYPDAVPAPAVPYQLFPEHDARQALTCTEEILDLVRSKISSGKASPAR